MRDDDIAACCAAHAPVATNGRFASGTVFGDWRLTAFIGRGGNGEVYCAEHATLGTSAAVKVLVREDERAKMRFAREAELLARLKSAAFPRFFAYGEANGHSYLAMELLEPGDLPTGDHAVARFMLKVCDAVTELHAQGLVHRDVKPGNILWRTGRTGVSPVEMPVPVLADLGLVKDVATSDVGHPTSSVTLGGAGTPGYGAPEQMERGEATFVSDIHALGVLADRCFGGKPPRAWARIVQRATSSIPAYRYPSVDALARAIRRRNLKRTLMIVFAVVSIFLGIVSCAVAASVLPKEPEEYTIQCYLADIHEETVVFYKRAMLLKSKIDAHEVSGADNDKERKDFKSLVEKERNELLRQWEAAKKSQDGKIRAWEKYVENVPKRTKNSIANAAVEDNRNNLRAWREKVDGLLYHTLYFSYLQL